MGKGRPLPQNSTAAAMSRQHCHFRLYRALLLNCALPLPWRAMTFFSRSAERDWGEGRSPFAATCFSTRPACTRCASGIGNIKNTFKHSPRAGATWLQATRPHRTAPSWGRGLPGFAHPPRTPWRGGIRPRLSRPRTNPWWSPLSARQTVAGGSRQTAKRTRHFTSSWHAPMHSNPTIAPFSCPPPPRLPACAPPAWPPPAG